MKTDIEMKAMAYDAFIESQKDKSICNISAYEGGVKGASISLESTYNAVKWAETLKDKKNLPRVKCKGNALYLPDGGSVDVMANLLGPNDTLHVNRRCY